MMKKVFLTFGPLILGFLLASIAVFSIAQWTLFRFDFHQNVFEKLQITSQLESLLNHIKTDALNLLHENLSDEEASILSSSFQFNLTSENIGSHLNQTLHELLEYIKDHRKNLPELYLKKMLPENKDPNLYDAIPEQLNAGTLLSYFDQNEILIFFLKFKLIYFIMDSLFFFSILIGLTFFCMSVLYYTEFSDLFSYWYKSFLSCCILLIGCFGALLFYPFPKNTALTKSLLGSHISMQNTLSSYVEHLENRLLWTLGGAILLLFLLIFLLKKWSKTKTSSYHIPHKKYFFLFLITLFFFIFFLKVEQIKDKNQDNHYASSYAQVFLNRPRSHIIPAKDDMIHKILIEFFDKDTLNPIADLPFEISKIEPHPQGAKPTSAQTNSDGRFTDKIEVGNYKISFPEHTIFEHYIKPLPYSFSIKKAGTLVLSMKVERTKPNPSFGNLEIIVLTDDKKPLENITLKLSPLSLLEESQPQPLIDEYAITNEKGKAIFQGQKGEYQISIDPSSIPAEYKKKLPFTVILYEQRISRYTLSLTKQ
jgi:hypothetical protein